MVTTERGGAGRMKIYTSPASKSDMKRFYWVFLRLGKRICVRVRADTNTNTSTQLQTETQSCLKWF